MPEETFAARLKKYIAAYHAGDVKAFARVLAGVAPPREGRGKRDTTAARKQEKVVHAFRVQIEQWLSGRTKEPSAERLKLLRKKTLRSVDWWLFGDEADVGATLSVLPDGAFVQSALQVLHESEQQDTLETLESLVNARTTSAEELAAFDAFNDILNGVHEKARTHWLPQMHLTVREYVEGALRLRLAKQLLKRATQSNT